MPDSFNYTITDGKKTSDFGWIKVQIKENLAPIANNDYIESYPQKRIVLSALQNDIDRENDSVFINDFTQPTHGTIEKTDNGFVYTPNTQLALTDSFHYTVTDGFNQPEKATVRIVINGKNHPNYPWLSMDIGAPGIKGSFKRSGNSYIIKASGRDIWNNDDECLYAYQPVKGDVEIVTKIKTLSNTHPWAKAGIMFRESLDARSKNTFLAVTGESGHTYQKREATNDGSQTPARVQDVSAPVWLKFTRKGDIFAGYHSIDGIKWIETHSDSVAMSENILVGFAVTSHNNDTTCTAVFDVKATRVLH